MRSSHEMLKARERKAQEVDLLRRLVESHENLLVIDLHRIPAEQIRLLRERLRDRAIIRTAKNRLFQRALESSKRALEKLPECLTGSNMFIFTNENPFQIAAIIRETRMKLPVRPGETAPCDAVVPAGNTGLPAGPVMGEFSEAGLPVKVELGSIVIVRDTTIVKKGEVVRPIVASVLSKLDIKPIESTLRIKVVYHRGSPIPADVLRISEVIESMLKEAQEGALKLAMGSKFFTDLTMPPLLVEAVQKCRWLASQVAFLVPEVLPEVLAKAVAEARAIAQLMEKSEKRA